MRYIDLAAVSACVMLSACGGSGNSVVGTPPPPIANPTPAPTPTPTYTPPAVASPAPPYSLEPTTTGTLAEALKTQQDFRTGSVQVEWDKVEGFVRSKNAAYGGDDNARFFTKPDNEGTYTLYNVPEGGYSYDLNLWDQSAKGWSRNSANGARVLTFRVPEVLDPSHPDLWLSYVSSGYWAYRQFDPSAGVEPLTTETFFYFGIPAAPSDLPRAGIASFNGVARGQLYTDADEYSLTGTATLSADFTAGSVATRMDLAGQSSLTGGTVDLGWFEGAGNIAVDANDFRGTWGASALGYQGSILGAFFGPEAQEFGYTFGINKPAAVGGGVVVGGQNSPPPPPPPPPPTPPPPAPPGSTFPLTTGQTFHTFSAATSYTNPAAPGPAIPGEIGTALPSEGRTISVTPDYASGTYIVRDGNATSAFSLPALFPSPDPNTRFVSLSDGNDDQLILLNNLMVGTGTNARYLQLHYLSFAFFYENDLSLNEHRTTALLFGNPTLLADLPRSGSATYTTQGFASALTGFGAAYADVQGRLTASFGSGTVDNVFSVYNYGGASVMPFYQLSGSGSITAGTALFSGSLTGSNNPLTGSFAGSFFGPSAEEAGFTFALTGTVDGTEQRIVGAAGGKR